MSETGLPIPALPEAVTLTEGAVFPFVGGKWHRVKATYNATAAAWHVTQVNVEA